MNGTMTRLFQAFPLEEKNLRMLQVLEQCRSELLKRKESIERRVRELLDGWRVWSGDLEQEEWV
jgi:hypothetical protein